MGVHEEYQFILADGTGQKSRILQSIRLTIGRGRQEVLDLRDLKPAGEQHYGGSVADRRIESHFRQTFMNNSSLRTITDSAAATIRGHVPRARCSLASRNLACDVTRRWQGRQIHNVWEIDRAIRVQLHHRRVG